MRTPLGCPSVPSDLAHHPMTAGGYQRLVQSTIGDWLRHGKKTGFVSADSGGVHIASSKGKRDENQDRAIFLRVQSTIRERPSIACIALCDGMGGMQSGSASADLAISAFASSLVTGRGGRLTERLELATEAANQAVHQEYKGKGGATLAAVACSSLGEWSAINVGDSRIYTFFTSQGLRQISTDDTLENMLSDLRLPSPSPEFRKLVRFIGMGDGLDAQSIALGQAQEVGWFVLVSDGAYGITEPIFRGIISHSETALDAALKINDVSAWIGGSDNSTVAILDRRASLFTSWQPSEAGSLQVVGVPGCLQLVIHSEIPKPVLSGPRVETRKAPRRKDRDKPDRQTQIADISRGVASGNVHDQAPARDIRPPSPNLVNDNYVEPRLDVEISECEES